MLSSEVGPRVRIRLPPAVSQERTGTLSLLDIVLYRRREAKGIQPPVETLRLGHGSCRDFAVLMIEAARSLGLAARFVSGYLAVPLKDREEPSETPGR